MLIRLGAFDRERCLFKIVRLGGGVIRLEAFIREMPFIISFTVYMYVRFTKNKPV